MASHRHPGSPGWTGPICQDMAGTTPKASAPRPDLPRPGPEDHLGELEAWGLVEGIDI